MRYSEVESRLLLSPKGKTLLFEPNGHSGAFLWLMNLFLPRFKVEDVEVDEGGSRGRYAAFQPGHVVELSESDRGHVWGLFCYSAWMKLGHWRTDRMHLPITAREPKTAKMFADRERAEMCAAAVREIFGYQVAVKHRDRGWAVEVTKNVDGSTAIGRSEATRLEGICMLLSKYAITPAPCEILDTGAVPERHESPAPHRPGRQVVRSRAAG